ncbi:ethylene-responsive protein kinase Le-CTR1-domain-containing protein, partial [Gorgonomyces haynaldii]
QCCAGPNTIQCCSLCDPQKWIFQGSEYDPTFSLLYARKDGCIGSYVKLQDPKFIIPWRYKNRKTSAISWKIIHQCGTQVKDAESETIVVNVERDTNLVKWIQMAKQHAKIYQDADLVEALLLLIHQALGSYGLPRGATSADADASLYRQMKKQGHNFMMLGQVKIGLCRHKALLFKILCDAVDLECALVTGYSTGGRHQWNLITLADKESYIIDPTSPHFTWTKQGSLRTKAYRVSADTSFGHGGLTMKMNGIL